MEKKWPPLETCPQFEYGYINPYVTTKFSWEDKENIQDWYDKYFPPPGSVSKEVMDSGLKAAKMFLHEIRSTRGYGYETAPPFFSSNFPFMELTGSVYGKGNYYETVIKETADGILAHISERTGRPYQLVNAVKLLWTNWLMLATIEAKECVPDSVTQTFYAAVTFGDYKVLECFLKPDEDAPPIYPLKKRGK